MQSRNKGVGLEIFVHKSWPVDRRSPPFVEKANWVCLTFVFWFIIPWFSACHFRESVPRGGLAACIITFLMSDYHRL